MITIEQVIELDDKVTEAAKLIESLKTENKMLSNEAEHYKKKVSELEKIISDLNRDQGSIQKSFQEAISTLDNLVSENFKSDNTPVQSTNSEENKNVASEENHIENVEKVEEKVVEEQKITENNESVIDPENNENSLNEQENIEEIITDDFIDLDDNEEEIEIF